MPDLQGGCLCGKVRYAITAEPIFVGACHCRNCQRSSGSAFNPVLAVPSAGASITGERHSYVGKGDSGQDSIHNFCPECGSPIGSEAAVMPGVTMFALGTLDEPEAVTPSMHIYCRSKFTWVTLPEGVGAFEMMPMPPG